MSFSPVTETVKDLVTNAIWQSPYQTDGNPHLHVHLGLSQRTPSLLCDIF